MTVTTGEKLYRLRNKLGISQKEFADKIGSSQAAVNFWENGKREPRTIHLQQICKAFNMTLDELMYDTLSAEEFEQEYTENSFSLTEGSAAEILKNLSKLNDTGQNKLVDYSKDLTKIPEYQKKD